MSTTMRMYILQFSAILFSFIIASFAESTEIVETDLGRIVGNVESVIINDEKVRVKKFLGIPYAKPPIGDRRFRKPKLIEEKFEGDFYATEYGAACMQPPTASFREFSKMSEDCLFLNIYVPDRPADQETGYAVMVFIHGGGFQHGAGESYPGESLSWTGNVIVVTLNYRLNFFGFFSTGDDVVPGNLGLWDQHVALQWVNRYITDFGGDRARVTVFGESAGASSAVYQGLLPQNKGLVHRIISQSGAPTLRLAINSEPKEQFLYIAQVCECLRDATQDMVSCIRQKDARSIIMTLKDIAASLQNPAQAVATIFFPVIDGEFFTMHPSEIYAKSKHEILESVEFLRELDVIFGHNSQEGALMLYSSLFYPIPDMNTFMPSRANLSSGLINAVMLHEFGMDTVHDVIKNMYIAEYTDWTDPFSPESIRQQYVNMMGNVVFDKSTIELVRIHVNSTTKTKRFAYIFDAEPSTRLLPTPSWLAGPNHADELGFVFGFMDKLLEDFKQRPTPPKKWEWELSKLIQIYWSNFAKTGDTNRPLHGGPTWPQYDLDSQNCFKFQRDMTETKSVTIPYCNARHSNFLLDIIPEVMSSISKSQDVTSPYRQEYSNTCVADGDCD